MGIGDIFKIGQFKSEIERLKSDNEKLFADNCAMNKQLQELGALDYYKIKSMTEQLERNMPQEFLN